MNPAAVLPQEWLDSHPVDIYFQTERECLWSSSSQTNPGFPALQLPPACATDLRRHQVQALVWTGKFSLITGFIACSPHRLQVREKFTNLLPLPTFPLEFPQEWGENPNPGLIFENSLAGISHSSQTRFSVKQHFSHTEKQGLWGQNIPKCWHKTVPHALIPCTKSHFICIYRPTAFEQDSSNGHLLQMVKEAEFCLITIRKIISWGLALHLSGCEGCRRRKNPPSLSDPRQGLPRRGWESRKYSQSKCVSLSHWAKNKYKTHKWHRSSWRAEILFAKFQPGVIFSFFFFFVFFCSWFS